VALHESDQHPRQDINATATSVGAHESAEIFASRQHQLQGNDATSTPVDVPHTVAFFESDQHPRQGIAVPATPVGAPESAGIFEIDQHQCQGNDGVGLDYVDAGGAFLDEQSSQRFQLNYRDRASDSSQQSEYDSDCSDPAGHTGQQSLTEDNGEAPSEGDILRTPARSNTVMSNRPKHMKSASKASQFYTTIVVIVCLNTRELFGFCGATKRATQIFQKVECGLRDRTTFPLPADVLLKDLMENSYFQGTDSEENFRKYCLRDSEAPVTNDMIALGERLYQHKFTDVKKKIVNHVLPRFLSILKKLTGDGTKSGYWRQA
jgi:hypothetical protein